MLRGCDPCVTGIVFLHVEHLRGVSGKALQKKLCFTLLTAVLFTAVLAADCITGLLPAAFSSVLQ